MVANFRLARRDRNAHANSFPAASEKGTSSMAWSETARMHNVARFVAHNSYKKPSGRRLAMNHRYVKGNVAGAIAAAFMLVSVPAVAAIPDANGVFHGCYNKV